MLRQFISGSIVAGVLATGATSAADDSGFYVGLGLGQAHNETGHFRDLEDSVAKAFAGYAFNEYLAAEVAYVDPQKADQTIDDVRVTLDPKGVIVRELQNAIERMVIMSGERITLLDLQNLPAPSHEPAGDRQEGDLRQRDLNAGTRALLRVHLLVRFVRPVHDPASEVERRFAQGGAGWKPVCQHSQLFDDDTPVRTRRELARRRRAPVVDDFCGQALQPFGRCALQCPGLRCQLDGAQQLLLQRALQPPDAYRHPPGHFVIVAPLAEIDLRNDRFEIGDAFVESVHRPILWLQTPIGPYADHR